MQHWEDGILADVIFVIPSIITMQHTYKKTTATKIRLPDYSWIKL